MDAERLIERLGHGARIIEPLVRGAEDAFVSWRPEAGAWSVREVIAHLLDEEREDFRVRLGLLLEDPESDWPPIDPERWATERDYASRDVAETVEAFLAERQASIAWLNALTSPDWNRAKDQPWGSMTAGDLLGAWVAHDLLHARQLLHLHWTYAGSLAAPHRTLYAGEWARGKATEDVS
jgi:hypothetical protein